MKSYNTRRQKWPKNYKNPGEDAQQLRAKCLQEILSRNTQLVTQLNYLTKMANSIIDEDTDIAMEYIQVI